MTPIGVIKMALMFLREFSFGKRPTAEYLRKNPFNRTLLVLFVIVFLVFLYLAESAMVVANVAGKKQSLLDQKQAELVVAQKKVSDLKVVIGDLKAKYTQHPHQDKFFICDPNAEEDAIGTCIR